MTLSAIASGVFTDPRKVLSGPRWNSAIWTPLALALGSALAVFVLYYNLVDFAWLQDYLTQEYTDPDKRAVAKRFITPKMLMTSSVAGLLVMVPLLYALTAAWLAAVSRRNGSRRPFREWFSFVAWTSLPSVLLLPLGAIQILLTENRQLGPEQLNPTTLNQLVFHLSRGAPWQGLLDSINLLSLWSVVIAIVGLQAWCGFGRMRSSAIVLTPYALIYAAWALYIVLDTAP